MSVHERHDWTKDYAQVTAFGAFLAEELDARELQRYYEKPWHWTSEREEWLRTTVPGYQLEHDEDG